MSSLDAYFSRNFRIIFAHSFAPFSIAIFLPKVLEFVMARLLYAYMPA